MSLKLSLPALDTRRGTAPARRPGVLIRTQRFFLQTTMPASDWRALLCAHVLASTSLATRVLMEARARGSWTRIDPPAGTGSLNRCMNRGNGKCLPKFTGDPYSQHASDRAAGSLVFRESRESLP